MLNLVDHDVRVDRDAFKTRVPELRMALLEAQAELRERGIAGLVLLGGDDRWGCSEVLDRLHEWLDPARMDTVVRLPVTDRERERPFPWRSWRDLPARGRIGVVHGGWPHRLVLEHLHETIDDVDFERRLAAIRERVPDREFDVDVAAEAAVPEGSRPLLTEAGLAPGCVIEGVYVMPGIPDELKAMFATVADEFAGDRRSRFLYTVEPESNIVPALEDAMERFDVAVGCYPDREADHNRLKVTATDDDALDDAAAWLLANVNASETPVRRNWD